MRNGNQEKVGVWINTFIIYVDLHIYIKVQNSDGWIRVLGRQLESACTTKFCFICY